jgi:PQQ-dependent dehydrogenase (methanol/ethanol family)
MPHYRIGRLFATVVAIAVVLGCHGISRADPALDQAMQNPDNWAAYGRTYSNERYSPLKQIDANNVSNLKMVWALQVGSLNGQEASPLVVDGTMYVSSSNGPAHVFAIDAQTGKVKWQYDYTGAADVAPEACCGLVSRGVSFADNKVLFGTLDGDLVALDAGTGKPAWKTKVVDYKGGAVITSPPLIVKNVAITGFGGGEYGVRGSLQAYNIANGKLAWRTYTVPGPWRDTWKGDSWKLGGGTAWNVGSYDPDTNTLLWGTSNPAPWNAAVRSTGTSDYGRLTNRGTSSTVALDPDNGRIKWEIQSTPADAWDYDGIVTPVLAKLQIDGQPTPVYLKDDRNGFFFVANLATGKLISAERFAPENWAKSFDVAHDRPVEDPSKRPRIGYKAADICPAAMGSTNWQSMSFNPNTGLAYIPVNNMCMDMQAKKVVYHRGIFYLGNDFSFHPGQGGWLGQLLAYNPMTQKPVWTVDRPLPWNGGTMTTAGNLVFQGDIEGEFHAYDAQSGKELWSMRLGSGIIAAPVTFAVGGKQYVAILAGRPQTMPSFMGAVGKQIIDATAQGGTLFVFGL